MNTKIFTIALMLMFSFSCNTFELYTNYIEGEGDITVHIIHEDLFSGIELNSQIDITVKQGSEQEIKIEGHPNIIEALIIYEQNGVLICGLEEGNYRNYELNIEITIPNIDYINIFGSGNITIEDFVAQESIRAVSSGSGDIIFNSLEGTESLELTIFGSGDIRANKQSVRINSIHAKINGSGNINTYLIPSNEYYVSIMGSGNSYCSVHSVLNAEIFGSGNVYYKSYPTINTKYFGSGRIVNMNDNE